MSFLGFKIRGPSPSDPVKGINGTTPAAALGRDLADDAAAQMWWRAAWNMDLSSKALAACCMMSATTLIAVLTMAWRITTPVQPRFIAVTPDGRAIPIEPLNAPLVSDAQILSYGREIAIQAYSYNFFNIKANLQKVGEHFLPDARAQFISSLTANDIIQSTIDNHRTVTAVPTGAPVILKEHVLPNGRYGWLIQMPLLVNYSAGNVTNQRSAFYVIKMVLVRTRVTSYPDGIAVAQFVVKQVNQGVGEN